MRTEIIRAFALTALVAAAGPALANAQAEVDSAVTALHNRDYDQAITLLSGAINSGNLSKDQSARPISTAAPPI